MVKHHPCKGGACGGCSHPEGCNGCQEDAFDGVYGGASSKAVMCLPLDERFRVIQPGPG